jgi:hypothetical protein
MLLWCERFRVVETIAVAEGCERIGITPDSCCPTISKDQEKVFGRRPDTVQTNATLGWPAFENLLSSSSAQAFQPQHSLRVHRLVVVDTVDGAKSLDTVDVLAAFVDEAVTLTVQSTVILFGNAWHTHPPHLWFPTRMRHP